MATQITAWRAADGELYETHEAAEAADLLHHARALVGNGHFTVESVIQMARAPNSPLRQAILYFANLAEGDRA